MLYRKQCSYHIHDLACIRRYISKSGTITLANALVSSCLDYCNSLLYGITALELKCLQHIQNTLCHILTRTSRYSSVRGHLKLLHWLPVKYRIQFKLCLITYKTMVYGMPPYFCPFVVPYCPFVSTRRSKLSHKFLTTYDFDYRVHKSKKHFDSCFLLLVPSCGIHYPWVLGQQTL